MHNIDGLLWKIDKSKDMLKQINKALLRYTERMHTSARYVVMRRMPSETLALAGVELVSSNRVPAGGYFIVTDEV